MLSSPAQNIAPKWMTVVLRLAAVYNVLWGAATIVLPNTTLGLLTGGGEIAGTTVVFWQGIGMIVGVYGIGYWIAGDHPYRHWPIVLVGMLGKIFGPIGFVDAVFIRGDLPVTFGLTILTNDLAWWVPFTLMLLGAYRDDEQRRRLALTTGAEDLDAAKALSDEGFAELAERSHERPLLVVFLRHFGCTYCRETLGELAKKRDAVERSGARLVLVHTHDDERGRVQIAKYNLPEHDVITDPDRSLYRAFELKRGTLGELFGARVWLRGVEAGLVKGHLVGPLQGDGFQMPGAFLVSKGRVVRAFRNRDAADLPDFEALCELEPSGLAESAAEVEAHIAKVLF
ncbi:MAG: peroxiredoxin-like family protein, partial [Planctomycetota bacterium]